MRSLEEYVDTARSAVVDTAQAFHLQATTDNGRQLVVPLGYQIVEPGFRPYRAGKASPAELQTEFDRILDVAAQRSVSVGIEGVESVRKLSMQMGLGVDCSNFAYRALETVHEQMGLEPYTETVFRSGDNVRALHATKKPSWDAKDPEGQPRDLTEQERAQLQRANLLDIAWIARVFGKDPEFVLGSAHICAPSAARTVKPEQSLPGDLLAFMRAGTNVVSHVAVIEQIETDDETVHADFWHSWHTRDFESGIRRDSVVVEPDVPMRWTHEGLGDPARYEAYAFLRPLAMARTQSTIQEIHEWT